MPNNDTPQGVDCSSLEGLYEAALILLTNAHKVAAWTNSDEQTDVELGGKMTPSIRKLVESISKISKLATMSSPGAVQPDGVTTKVNSLGVLSVVTATSNSIGLVKPDGTTINIDAAGKIFANIATLAQAGIVKPDGTTITIKPDGTISVSVGAVYELGEIYYFRNPTLRPGFQPCQGGLLQQAVTLYPQIWAYLQTTEGRQLCTTESEWQAMTQATWGDGSFKASWNGIGGAPYFVQDLNAGTLRMPDIRGMFACAAGDGTYAPSMGGAKGDTTRPVTGSFMLDGQDVAGYYAGVFHQNGTRALTYTTHGSNLRQCANTAFGSPRVVPTGVTNLPRSWGALASVYLGQPATT